MIWREEERRDEITSEMNETEWMVTKEISEEKETKEETNVGTLETLPTLT